MKQELEDWLERMRIKLKLNRQNEIANETGLSKVTLSTFVNRHNIPSIGTLLKIAEVLDKKESEKD